MDKSSTLEKTNENKVAVAGKVRQSTIYFLKQFARAYSFEKRIGIQLGGFVAN